MSRAGINLSDLASLPLWVGWRTEIPPGRDKPTKVPYDPITGRKAKCTSPKTWGTRQEAQGWKEKFKGGGVAVMFADIGNGQHLGGVDLDTCRDPQSGATEPWAQAIIERLATYCEVSPSATGHKAFFLYEPQPEIDKIFGGKGGRVFKNGNGSEHPPSIEVYVNGRFFAVTDDASSPHDVVLITPDDLR
jgi:primase-polymerase (primpol)-like protein